MTITITAFERSPDGGRDVPWQHRLMAVLYDQLGLARAAAAALRQAEPLGRGSLGRSSA